MLRTCDVKKIAKRRKRVKIVRDEEKRQDRENDLKCPKFGII